MIKAIQMPSMPPYYRLNGALVSPTQILSAQTTAMEPVGSKFVIGGDEVRTITDVWQHPFMHISVITLDRPSTKKPIRIATHAPPPGTMLTMLGRGDTTIPDVDYPLGQGPQGRPVGAPGQLKKALVKLVRWTGRGSFGEMQSPIGAMGCDGDAAAPVFIPKGEMGRTDDELVGLMNATDCTVWDIPAEKRRNMRLVNAAYYQQTLPQAKMYLEKLKACRGSYAAPRPYDASSNPNQPKFINACPKTAPWDTGLGYDCTGSDACVASWHFTRYPCSKTKACADVVYDMMRSMVDAATPKVRNNPVPDNAAAKNAGPAPPPMF
jgi:hypothetical protein